VLLVEGRGVVKARGRWTLTTLWTMWTACAGPRCQRRLAGPPTTPTASWKTRRATVVPRASGGGAAFPTASTAKAATGDQDLPDPRSHPGGRGGACVATCRTAHHRLQRELPTWWAAALRLAPRDAGLSRPRRCSPPPRHAPRVQPAWLAGCLDTRVPAWTHRGLLMILVHRRGHAMSTATAAGSAPRR
jgi:hypothetical protein